MKRLVNPTVLKRYGARVGSQRQSRFECLSDWLQLVLCVFLILISARVNLRAEDQIIPLPAPVLSVTEVHGLLWVGLGKAGVGWVDPEAPALGDSLLIRQDWPTMSVCAWDDRSVLLAGRDNALRVVEPRGEGMNYAVRLSWPVEGIPCGVAVRGDVIAVAESGAGVAIYTRPNGEETPRLSGRYPFVTFARQVAFLNDTTLLVADSHELGMAVLDVSDPTRPHRLASWPVRGYCDSVDSDGRNIFFTNRVEGVQIVQYIPLSQELMSQTFIPMRNFPTQQDENLVQKVVWENRLLYVCERKVGIRVMEYQPTDHTWKERQTLAQATEPIDLCILDSGEVAIADFTGRVIITRADDKH